MVVTECEEESKRKKVLLAKFSNGTVNEDHADALEVRLLGRTESTNLRLKEHRMLVAESENMTYIGKNYGDQASKSKGWCKYYVGVLDPKTNKMRVCDTEMFGLEPQVAEDEITRLPEAVDSYREKVDMLTSAFGSATSRKIVATRKGHFVKSEDLKTVMSSAVDQGLSKVDANSTGPVVEPSTSTTQSILPSCNRDASSVVDVYNLSDILSDVDMENLTSAAKTFFECKASDIIQWREQELYPTYVLKQLSVLPLGEGPRWVRCKLLVYMHYLIHMFRLRSNQVKTKDPLPKNWPSPIKEKILHEFSVQVAAGNRSVRCCPLRLKDKAVFHLLVLALFVDEFCVDTADLRVDLRMGQDNLTKHFQALGCNVTKKAKGKDFLFEATLKLPLYVVREGKQKGKKK